MPRRLLFLASPLLFACNLWAAQPTFSSIPSLSFVKPFGGADPLPQVVTFTSTGTNFDFSYDTTTSGGGNWLSIQVVGFNCCVTPRALNVVVTTAADLAPGTYGGQITVKSTNNLVSMMVPVGLTVESPGATYFDNLPGQLSFALKTGGSTITSQSLQIRNGGSGTLHWNLSTSTSDGGSWLNVSASSGTAPSLVNVGVSVSNVPGGGAIAGHFIGQLVLSQALGGSVTIPISVVVGANIFSQVNGLNFDKPFGGADPLPQTLTIPSTGTNFDFDYRVYNAKGGNWLSVAIVGFNCCVTPRALTAVVTTDPALQAGTYTGEIVFTIEGDGSMAITVPVTLTVEPPGGAFFNSLPGQLSFALKTGGTSITPQDVLVTNGGVGILNWNLAKSTSDANPWLTVSSVSGAAPSKVSVGVSVANLPGGGLIAGTFIGELVFSQPSGGSVTIPVSVAVGSNIFSQVNGISFTKVFGGANPLPQTVTVPSTGGNFDFDYRWYTATGGSWLSVSVVGFNCCVTPRAMTVSVTADPALPVGTYTGEVIFTVEGNGSMAVTVPVTLTVEPPTSAFFANMPGQLSYALKTGGNSIPSQPVQVLNGGSGTVSWTSSKATSDGGDWITVSAASGTAPSLVNIGILPANLPGGGLVAGNFIGEVTFAQPNGGSVTIPISVAVGANIFRQVNPISFTKMFGGADPLPQTLTIASTGTNFDFDSNVYTATGGSWLSVSFVGFNCCATSRAATVTVTADPNLAPGTYTGEIIFTVEGNGSMAITVPVTLTIVPANGTFLDDVQGQVSFSFTPGSGNPTAQTVQIRKRGTGNLNWTLETVTSDGGNWLTVSANSGAAPANVSVGVTASALPGGGLVAGTFVGELVIHSTASTTTIPVSVSVGANVFVEVPTITFNKLVGGANPVSTDVTIASTGANFDFDHLWYTSNGGNWLSVTVAGFNCCATPRAITANIVASPQLAAGTYTGQIVVTVEGNGSEAMTIPVILTVASGAPSITSVTPNMGQLGQTLTTVGIVGQNTNFANGSTVADFGAGIIVNSLSVTGPTTATANITIKNNAVPGARTVTLTTGGETASLANGFTVAAPLNIVSFSVMFGSQKYNLTAGGGTRNRLPWQVTGIQVVFSQAVTSGNANSLGGIGATGFSGLGTNTLTWTFAPLSTTNLLATLAGTGGNALIGASGAPLAGGAGYSQALKILFGDFNDDGVVSAADLVGVNNATVASYNIFADINGDGAVTVADVQLVRTRIGASLP